MGLHSPTAGLVELTTPDGGGVRGLSSLLILRRLMYIIENNHDNYKLPKPCDVFDIIAGTSTGALIAIMLGRLVSLLYDFSASTNLLFV